MEDRKSGQDVLKEKLEAFLQRFYRLRLLRGLVIASAASLVILLFVSGLEWALRISSQGRAILFWSTVFILLAVFSQFVFLPALQLFRLWSRLPYSKVASLIGKHFSGLDDKIINALQLGQLKHGDQELLMAALRQKVQSLQAFQFTEAIDFREVKRFVPHLIVPLLVFVVLLVTEAGRSVLQSSQRVLRYSENFTPPSPFHFVVLNDSLRVEKGDPLELTVALEGESIPVEMSAVLPNRQLRLSRKNNSTWTLKLDRVEEPLTLFFEAGGYLSNAVQIDVVAVPRLRSTEVQVYPPSYTGAPARTFGLSGDFKVLEGSRVVWNLKTEDADEIYWSSGSDEIHSFENGTYFHRATQSLNYKISARHQSQRRILIPSTILSVVPDAPPTIDARFLVDSTEELAVSVGLRLNDDYGLTKLTRVLKINNQEYRTRLEYSGEHQFSEYLKLDSLIGDEKQKVELYYEVWDNDAINGAKSSRSASFFQALKSKAERIKEWRESVQNISKSSEENREFRKQLDERLEKALSDVQSKSQADWKDQEQLKELLDEFDNLLKDQEENRKRLKDKLQKEDANEQLKDLLEQDSKEMDLNKLKDEIEKLMDKLDLNKLQEKLKDLKKENQEQLRQEERLDKLLEDLMFQRDLLEQIEKLEQLSEELKEQDIDEKSLNEEFNKVNEELDRLKDKSSDLQKEMDSKDFQEGKDQAEEGFEEMQNDQSETESDKQDASDQDSSDDDSDASPSDSKSSPSPSQQKASDGTQKMSESVRASFESMQSKAMQQNMQSLRRILENVGRYSNFVEENAIKIKNLQQADPLYRELLKNQSRLALGSKVIEDSLKLLSERSPQVKEIVFKELQAMKDNLAKATEALQEQSTPSAASSDQASMMAANNLALLLEESLDNMMQMMAQKKPGKQNCQKPGQGNPKPGAKGQMMDEMGDMIEKLEKGKKEGIGKGERGMSGEEMAEMLKKQEALRKLLNQSQADEAKLGSGNKPNKELSEDLNQLEDLILEGDIDNIKERFKRIESRMLESEKADLERKQKEERESQSAEELKMKEGKTQPAFESEKDLWDDALRYEHLKLTPFYQSLR